MINIIKNLYAPLSFRLRLFISIVLLCSLPLTSSKADFDVAPNNSRTALHQRASEQMQQGNYAIAYCIWQPLAEQNDSKAQYNIGWMYHNGYGLMIDDTNAFFWWVKSAAAGNTDAEYALGDLYLQGQGVEQDLSIALGWYLSAALKGHEAARETLLALLAEDKKVTRKMLKSLLKSDWSIFSNTMQVRVDKANTRSGPGKQFTIVTTLQRGHIVIPLRQQDGWTEIGITGMAQTAWIFSRLIEKSSIDHAS